MKIFPPKKLYLPAYSIIAIICILLVLISISMYRNLDREKKTAMTFVHRQGLTLLRALEAGARTGIMMNIWKEDTVGILIQQVAQNEDIAYIYFFDQKGIIIHHTDTSLKGKMTTWNLQHLEKKWVYSRIRKLPDGTTVYEMAKLFSPLQPDPSLQFDGKTAPPQNTGSGHLHTGDGIVLGIKMSVYEAARRSDILHAFVMAAILLMLGSGTIFFIFVIQNYFLVGRTLRHTQDYAGQIVENMANGLLSVDLKGKIVSYNQVAVDLLGIDQTNIVEMDLKSKIDFHVTGLQEVLDTCRTVSYKEIKYHKDDNKRIPIGISASPIRDENGRCREAVLILRDLREIKQLEEKIRRSEKLAAVGQLAAGIAHEIRNPLSSIRGFAQFLQHSLKDRPKEREYAEIMVREMDRINRVVTDLLSFANPREAELEKTNIRELTEHVVRLVDADARSKDIRIQTEISSEVDIFPLDAYQMTQALLNLLLNAIKFVDKGGWIRIRTFDDKANSQFVIQVEDNGPGIVKENLNKIFDPFFTTRETGTGLGLAIVHKIVENHNGDIEVESPPPGKSSGCRMTIRIPMDPTKP